MISGLLIGSNAVGAPVQTAAGGRHELGVQVVAPGGFELALQPAQRRIDAARQTRGQTAQQAQFRRMDGHRFALSSAVAVRASRTAEWTLPRLSRVAWGSKLSERFRKVRQRTEI